MKFLSEENRLIIDKIAQRTAISSSDIAFLMLDMVKTINAQPQQVRYLIILGIPVLTAVQNHLATLEGQYVEIDNITERFRDKTISSKCVIDAIFIHYKKLG